MIRVLLVEDQEIVRRGLKTLLELQPDLQVVSEAENGQQALQQMAALTGGDKQPDVILMDVRMPLMDGVAATQQICQQFPEAKILILTTFDDSRYVSEALRFGAKGYLLKDTPAPELAAAIRGVYKGYTHLGPGILEKMITAVPPSEPPVAVAPTPPPELADLTPRERQVLGLVADGLSNREIALKLFLSEGTVRNHISRILDRLNLRDRTQAALFATTFRPWLTGPTPRDRQP